MKQIDAIKQRTVGLQKSHRNKVIPLAPEFPKFQQDKYDNQTKEKIKTLISITTTFERSAKWDGFNGIIQSMLD